jgi:fructokinase
LERKLVLMSHKLIGIGELLIDFFGETKTTFIANPGGAPANVAVAVSRLGGSSMVLTKVGEDAFGSFLIDTLSSYHVNTDYIRRTEKANTALAFVTLDKNGERKFFFYRSPSADMLLSPEEIPAEVFKKDDILHFCSVDLVDYPVRKAHVQALKYAAENGTIISFDPNLRYNLWNSKEDLLKTVNMFIDYADIVKVSSEELIDLTGETNRLLAAKKILRGRVKLVIVTLGKDGAEAYTFTGLDIFSAGVEVAKVVDTTGAGDTFIGAFIFRILSGKQGLSRILTDGALLKEYLDYANKAASFCVRSKGAMTSMPDKKDME